MQSNSEGRLRLYCNIKPNPVVEHYASHSRSVGGRHVMAGLRVGCLPLVVETGRYTNTPYRERLCRLCSCGEVEDIVSILQFRTRLFNQCATLDTITITIYLLLRPNSSYVSTMILMLNGSLKCICTGRVFYSTAS